MTYIRILKDGKSQVIKDLAFSSLLNNTLPDQDKSIRELISEFDKAIQLTDPSVTKDALNNVHGDWYEWLLAIAAWNYCVDNEHANLVLLTPNISQFTIAKLYNEKLYGLILDLRQKVLLSSSVQLISSNPDFVIIDRSLVNKIIPNLTKITTIDQNEIIKIDQAHRAFEGECDFDDIIGYISVKTSFRPDRRLQISHEGSLMKAIYTHLQTREWILNPKGIKYYAMATKVGLPDRLSLKTVATHSITSVQSIPQAAVDDVFEVDTMRQAQIVFERILNP
ncbi:Cfr10I/Bse634I family restriction endonuclease [Mucilaginibacter celer]|uniref:Restriction endonuclease n=1 Tax=Mucilaginibacter celer TaxID=2305508 RepID=A0A494VX60_9SPHI|nr:Cfr10I/Bse634I family restriction endonuclease [Mucilaginibacter celer]AYL98050.1 restriction endonuclease [Mucilaginibacter celer]